MKQTRLVSFTWLILQNRQGLEPIGESFLIETPSSGPPVVANPFDEGFGKLLQGSLEGSNVNVVQQLVDMIETQRAYEVSSKSITPVFPTVDLAADNSDKSGAIYQQGQSGLFSSDRRARKVGDILTVDFNEVFAATKAQSAASSKSDSFELGLPTAIPNILTGGLANVVGGNEPGLSSSTAQSFSGSGNAAQSNSLTGRLSVTVVRIFENGNMGILGRKS